MSALAIDLTDAAVTGAILAAGTAPHCCGSRPSQHLDRRWPFHAFHAIGLLLLAPEVPIAFAIEYC